MSRMPYKLIFFRLIFHLMECLQNYQLLPQDFADSLSSHMSVTINSCVLVILMTKMFFFGTIECMSPPEWPESWEKAAEAFCLTDGTYRMPPGMDNDTAIDNRTIDWQESKLRIDYYYWIPYIFMGQSVILKAPDFLWHFYCDLDPKKPMTVIKEFAFLVGNQEIMRKGDSARANPESLANCVQQQNFTVRLAEHLLSRNKLVNFDTWHLFAVYMLSKLLRLAALVCSLFYLQSAFCLDSPLFGISLANNSLQGIPWEETNLFPRWAYCDVHTRHLGNWNTRVMQCALPINLLLERVLLFYWFWLLLCAVSLLVSAIAWAVAMLPVQRRNFAQTFLSYLSKCEPNIQMVTPQNRRKLSKRNEKLIEMFTGIDRAFLLQLAEERLGLATVYLAMDRMADISRKTDV